MIRACQSVAVKRLMIERLSDDENGQKSPLKIIDDEDQGDKGKTISAMANLDREIYPYFV